MSGSINRIDSLKGQAQNKYKKVRMEGKTERDQFFFYKFVFYTFVFYTFVFYNSKFISSLFIRFTFYTFVFYMFVFYTVSFLYGSLFIIQNF